MILPKVFYQVNGLIAHENDEYVTYNFDVRGSTTALTDESGAVTDRMYYAPYGELVVRTGDTETPFLYSGLVGVQTDENGLYYMRARYYNPEIKRFVNKDILRGSIADSTSLNRYSYVNGNPVSYIDPFGLSKEPEEQSGSGSNLDEFKEKYGISKKYLQYRNSIFLYCKTKIYNISRKDKNNEK